MALIKAKAEGHRLTLEYSDPLAAGSAGVDAFRAELDGAWEGFSVAAAFRTEEGLFYSVFENGEAAIPAAALAKGCLAASLYGVREENGAEKRLTTNYITVSVPDGAGADGTTPPEPEETIL